MVFKKYFLNKNLLLFLDFNKQKTIKTINRKMKTIPTIIKIIIKVDNELEFVDYFKREKLNF